MFEIRKREKKDCISFLPEQCIKSLHKKSSCTLCLDICPTKAIDWSIQEGIKFKSKQCIGCGACISICPTSAFGSKKFTDQEILDKLENCVKTKPLLFTCKEVNLKDENILPIPCLARLDASMLLLFKAQGFEEIICLHQDCYECYGKNISEYILSMVEKANSYLQQFLHVKSIEIKKIEVKRWFKKMINPFSPSMSIEGVSRRNFIKNLILAKKKRVVYQTSFDKELLFQKHWRLQKAVTILAMAYHLENIKFLPLITIDESLCQNCAICEKICPTGALHVISEYPFILELREYQCIECGLCEDICFTKAIYFKKERPLSDLTQAMNKILIQREKAEACSIPIYRT